MCSNRRTTPTKSASLERTTYGHFLWELVRGRCIDEHLKSRVSVPNNGRAARLLINWAREFGRIEQRVLQQYGRTLPHECIDKAADTAVTRFMCAVDSIMIRDR